MYVYVEKKKNLNSTNWARHLNACRMTKKKNSSSKYLSTYFKRFLTPSSSTSTESAESDAKKIKKTGKYTLIL